MEEIVSFYNSKPYVLSNMFCFQIHKIKRLSKAKEFHMSEDEKKKRRKSSKKVRILLWNI
jgi:hypothetical protein